jgi:hypothetical protein
VNALRVEVQSQVYKVDISCAFSIAEKTTLDSISTSKQAKFGCGNSSALTTSEKL